MIVDSLKLFAKLVGEFCQELSTVLGIFKEGTTVRMVSGLIVSRNKQFQYLGPLLVRTTLDIHSPSDEPLGQAYDV